MMNQAKFNSAWKEFEAECPIARLQHLLAANFDVRASREQATEIIAWWFEDTPTTKEEALTKIRAMTEYQICDMAEKFVHHYNGNPYV